MVDFDQLEKIASELIHTFEIEDPPVPIEIMLQRPKPDMWEEVNIADLSVGFLKTGGHYSPRMSLTRLLARHIIKSDWGDSRGLPAIMKQGKADEVVNAFGRMLIMPQEMVKALSEGARTPITMSMHFEVPEEDAVLRLKEVFGKL
ncbi:MAG: hypothetical protein ABI970_01380 [Chloroflexota bacterium]